VQGIPLPIGDTDWQCEENSNFIDCSLETQNAYCAQKYMECDPGTPVAIAGNYTQWNCLGLNGGDDS
jgi:hypothetical protein